MVKHIAILGASSRIARDLIIWFNCQSDTILTLFVRRPDEMQAWLKQMLIVDQLDVRKYSDFGTDVEYFAVINCVGAGDPSKILLLGSKILELSYRFDSLVLDYLKCVPCCRYLFLSSGAAYGSCFESPVHEQTQSVLPINFLGQSDWYGISKIYAECRHRSCFDLPIVDIRIFNYISKSLDLSSRFMITDAIRAIQQRSLLLTSSSSNVRDYLHAHDFCSLIHSVLSAPPANDVIDCYSLAPIAKFDLLAALKTEFGMSYQSISSQLELNATGLKPFYYSLNRRASSFGYSPEYTSLAGILETIHAIID